MDDLRGLPPAAGASGMHEQVLDAHLHLHEGGGPQLANGSLTQLGGLDPGPDTSLQQEADQASGASQAAWQQQDGTSTHQIPVQHDDSAPLQALRLQKEQYLEWFRQVVAMNAGSEGSDSAPPPSLPAPLASADLPALVATIHTASMAQAHVSALKYWADAVRELERRLRDVSSAHPAQGGRDAAAYEAAVDAGIEAVAGAAYAAELATSYTPAAGALPKLAAAGETIAARMRQCRHELRSRICSEVAESLEAVGWPPALAAPVSKAAAITLPNGDAHEHAAAEQGLTNGNGPAGLPAAFAGFDVQPERLQRLLAALAALTRLQQAVDRQGFATAAEQAMEATAAEHGDAGQPQELPLLWAAECLAAPLQARLSAHFQPFTPSGRLDQPAWLFRVVMRLVQDHMTHVAALQPALDAAGLGGRAAMPVEWARAMRDATKAVLRTTRLPALVEVWEQTPGAQACALWQLHVDAMLAFEAELGPFLGAPPGLVGLVPALPAALLPGCVLGSITGEPTFMAAWLQVLRHGALSTLEAAAADPRAWQVRSEADAEEVDDGAGPPGVLAPTAKEYNPPRFAVAALDELRRLVEQSQAVPTAAAQRELLDGVGPLLLRRVKDTLTAAFHQVAAYPGVASEGGAPLAGACVSGARFVHDQVAELLSGPPLQRLRGEGEGPEGAAGDGSPARDAAAPPAAAVAHSPAGSSDLGRVLPPGVSLTPSPVKHNPLQPPMSTGLLGEVVVRHSFTPVVHNPPVMAAAVLELGGCHREWCLCVARQVAHLFGRAAAELRAAVTSTGLYPAHSGTAGTVSPVLAPALAAVQAGLAALHGPLDAPSFRDIWRAVAVPLNRFLFNCIVAEARFTAAGGAQFEVDCGAILGLFVPYTRRATAHFREATAAMRLLALPDSRVSDVVRRVSAAAVSYEPLYRDPVLAELGLGCLTPAQVVGVIERRV